MIIIDQSGRPVKFNNIVDFEKGKREEDGQYYISYRLINNTCNYLGVYNNENDMNKDMDKITRGYKYFKRVVRL